MDEQFAKIHDVDDEVRTEAWLRASEQGASAVGPLGSLMSDDKLETARAAKNGLWRLVRRATRPGADGERKAVISELIGLLGKEQPARARSEVLWMLSEIGGDESVAPIAKLLANQDVREDARMALENIPGRTSLTALRAGLAAAPDDFKLNIAQSLRARGTRVPGLPCRKLTPTKQTGVKEAETRPE